MKTAAIGLAVAGFAVAGCGGGSDTSSTASQAQALSKAQFLSQANSICRKENARLNQAAAKRFGKEQPSAAEVRDFLGTQVIPAFEDEVASIRELGAPPGDEATVDAILSAVEQGAKKARSNPDLLQARGSADPLFRAIKLARAYGLTDCAAQ